MKFFWCHDQIKYDGSQLHSRFAFNQFNISGDSIVGWRGPCEVSLDHMVDGEDRLAQQKICGADMVHFIVEVSHFNLLGITVLQRLLASLAKDIIEQNSSQQSLGIKLIRLGDDLFAKDRKLSISVATRTPISAMIHFAVNVTNEATPVPTLSLQDLKMDPVFFAKDLMQKFCVEFDGIKKACEKVSPVL